MPSKQNWLSFLKQTGSVWEYRKNGPHASYEMAKKHADFYFNTDVALNNPEHTAIISEFFVEACHAERIKPDWVASYTTTVSSGLVLAAKIAEKLSAHFGYVDLRDNLCRFHLQPAQTVLLVTDDIHSGKSLKQMIELVEKAGGQIVPLIMTMANFSSKATFENRKIVSLFEYSPNVYTPDECLLCKQGSKALNARRNWHELIRENNK